MLVQLAACQTCHTGTNSPPFSGGYPLKTKFGTFVGSNITPDPETGIGSWTETDFLRAMRDGKNPDGKPYYPAFPYTSFTGLTDSDIRDIFAYLATVPPVYRKNESHDLRPLYRNRGLLGFWRLIAFKRNVYPTRSEASEQENLGRYLVDVVGHCGECHTPRSGLGRMKRRRWLGGQTDGDEYIPNITTGALSDWTLEDMETFLEAGMLPDGDFTGGDMLRVVEDCTGKLSDEQRRAMSLYLKTVKPVRK